jgi:hypothetical protein
MDIALNDLQVSEGLMTVLQNTVGKRFPVAFPSMADKCNATPCVWKSEGENFDVHPTH